MPTILVVDDSPVDRLLVGGLLEKEPGWEVAYASQGVEALAVIAARPPDLVLTDLVMPEMDGLELVSAVRSRHPLIPVILMTSKGSEETATRALQQGAASYVPKRLLANELLDTIHWVLSVSGQQRSHERLLGSLSRCELYFELENDRGLFAPLVGFLQDSLANLGLCGETERIRVGVALEEALVNALDHGNLETNSALREQDFQGYYRLLQERARKLPYRERRIRVEAQMSRNEARIVVRDEGPGFDPAALPDPAAPANLEKISGRGLLLMRTFMDEVTYNARGNEVTLVKRCPGTKGTKP